MTIKQLLVWTFVVGVFLALVGQLGRTGFGVFIVLALLAPWVARWPREGFRTTRREVKAVLVFGIPLAIVLVVLLVPRTVHVQFSEEVKQARKCMTNLRQLGEALRLYHADHGCFPPAYIADERGRPLHSWRVQILPYIEQEGLYEKYDFDEPWDGPNNRKLHDAIIPAFCCPCDCDNSNGTSMTSYVAVVGPETMWPGKTRVSWGMIRDGTSNTIMLVEVAQSGIHWMDPRDLHVTQMSPTINPSRGQGISSGHPNGANVLFADGHTQSVWEVIDVRELRAMVTVAGGESVVY